MNGFNYHRPSGYEYEIIDPTKYRFANASIFRPPTPPIFQPPKDPLMLEEELRASKEEAEKNVTTGGDVQAPDTMGTASSEAAVEPTGEDTKESEPQDDRMKSEAPTPPPPSKLASLDAGIQDMQAGMDPDNEIIMVVDGPAPAPKSKRNKMKIASKNEKKSKDAKAPKGKAKTGARSAVVEKEKHDHVSAAPIEAASGPVQNAEQPEEDRTAIAEIPPAKPSAQALQSELGPPADSAVVHVEDVVIAPDKIVSETKVIGDVEVTAGEVSDNIKKATERDLLSGKAVETVAEPKIEGQSGTKDCGLVDKLESVHGVGHGALLLEPPIVAHVVKSEAFLNETPPDAKTSKARMGDAQVLQGPIAVGPSEKEKDHEKDEKTKKSSQMGSKKLQTSKQTSKRTALPVASVKMADTKLSAKPAIFDSATFQETKTAVNPAEGGHDSGKRSSTRTRTSTETRRILQDGVADNMITNTAVADNLEQKVHLAGIEITGLGLDGQGKQAAMHHTGDIAAGSKSTKEVIGESKDENVGGQHEEDHHSRMGLVEHILDSETRAHFDALPGDEHAGPATAEDMSPLDVLAKDAEEGSVNQKQVEQDSQQPFEHDNVTNSQDRGPTSEEIANVPVVEPASANYADVSDILVSEAEPVITSTALESPHDNKGENHDPAAKVELLQEKSRQDEASPQHVGPANILDVHNVEAEEPVTVEPEEEKTVEPDEAARMEEIEPDATIAPMVDEIFVDANEVAIDSVEGHPEEFANLIQESEILPESVPIMEDAIAADILLDPKAKTLESDDVHGEEPTDVRERQHEDISSDKADLPVEIVDPTSDEQSSERPLVLEEVVKDSGEKHDTTQVVVIEPRHKEDSFPKDSINVMELVAPARHKRHRVTGLSREHRASSKGGVNDSQRSSRHRRESHGSGNSTRRSMEMDVLFRMAKDRKISRRHTSHKDEGSEKPEISPYLEESFTTKEMKKPEHESERKRIRPRLLEMNNAESNTGLLFRVNKDKSGHDHLMHKEIDVKRSTRTGAADTATSSSSSHHREHHHHHRHHHRPRLSENDDLDEEARLERRRRRREADEAYARADEELRRKRRELEDAQRAAARARDRKKDRERAYRYEKGKEDVGTGGILDRVRMLFT